MKNKIFVILIILLILIFVYSYFVEPNFLFTKNIEMNFEIGEGIKIVIFSDLHIGKFKNGVSIERVVEKVNKLNPGIVLIPGDFVFEAEDNDFEELDYLSEINGQVFAVLGNHDLGFPGEDKSKKLKAVLEKNNIKLIDNTIERIGESVVIIGLSDFYQGKTDYALLENQKTEDFVLVLTHNPDSTFSFPENSNVDLVISGHTHGGQIRIPLLYKKIIPTEYNFNRGVYKINNVNVLVTSGIGMSTFPFRFLIPPEIVILEVK